MSIIAPVFNEQAVIETYLERVVKTIKPLEDRYNFEIILVDDGSTDDSLAIMKRLIRNEARLRIIELRRHFGQTQALQAGLDAAHGTILVTMDSDLQHFPEEIPQFLDKLKEGYDMVCGWRRERAEGVLRRWPSYVANLLIKRIAGLPVHDCGTTYRAYRAELVKDLRLFGEFHRFVPALGREVGGKITEIPIRNIKRPAGKNSYGIGRSFGVFLDLFVLFFFVRYMDRPMRAFGKLAILWCAAGVVIMTYMVLAAGYYDVPMFREHPGWFLLSANLILASVHIMLAGILAEILVRIHYGQGNRRVYKTRHEWKLDNVEGR